MASETMTLKLLVDNRTKKVLYAEATKEFVDFLLNFLSLPLGTLIDLVGSKNMVGGLGKLKESVESFNQVYLQPGISKDNIFTSKRVFNGNMSLLSDDVSANDKPPTSRKVYSCRSFEHDYSCNCLGKTENPAKSTKVYSCTFFEHPYSCNCCGMTENPATLEKLRGGFVKEDVTYMVMDDLVVKPMSAISSINLIKSFAEKDLSQLEEKTLQLGKDEALKLLWASLSTNEVLTSLFRQTNNA